MFRTELTIAPVAQQLPPTARVLTMGSCFADSIGARLAADKVNVLVNPFGTVFQPLAAARLLRAALGEDVDWQQHLVEARGRWQSYDLHGSQGAASPVELLHDIQQTVRRMGEFLRGADVVLLTLGTAWAYRLRETGELVSNCHKMPAELFEKELLTPDEIISSLAETHAYLRRSNPKLRVVLTVSPVRHLRDTLPLNAVSKSVLRVACHYLSELLPDVSYFPAYELLTDDLRDYRFYAADMLHPSEVAQDYIWEKFARTYFDADFGRFRKELAGVRQALGHRPLNPAAPEHRRFLETTREQLERLSRQRVNVAAELREVDARLAALPVPAAAVVVEPEPNAEERIDIGADAGLAEATTPPEQLTAVPDRTPRLSPEEFRAQRAARNKRPERNRRDEAPHATAPLATGTEEALPPVPEVADTPALATSQAAELLTIEGVETEPAKNKKRRSRGGAKRTARKNAAKLAATDDAGKLSANEPDATVEAAQVAAPRNPQPEGRKSSVITKSVPVKRGGRGRERAGESSAQPSGPAPVEPPTESSAAVAELAAPESLPTPSTPIELGTEQVFNRRKSPKAKPLFATPVGEATAATATPAHAAVPAAAEGAPAAPARTAAAPTSRRRAVVSIATVPTPIPAVELRADRPAGVAAGRMRGSSATLVVKEPAKEEPAKKTPAPRRKSPKTAAAPTPPPPVPAAPAPLAAKRPAKPRAKKATAPPDAGENPA